jgi:hypothetical protein
MHWGHRQVRTKIVGLAAALLAGSVPLTAIAQQMPGSTAPSGPAVGAPSSEGASQVPDATVQKAGAALRHIAQIRQGYSPQMSAATTPEQQQAVAQQAAAASERAITDQGLTVDQYNQVVRLALADPTFKQRLLAAAQQAQ